MPIAPAVTFYEFVLALHIMAVVVAFGVTFAYPIMFMVAAKSQPRRCRCCTASNTRSRRLINPACWW